MKAFALSLFATLALLFGFATPASASSLPPCPTEDSINCYWDANTMGNGRGSSFVNVNGVITYTSPIEEHTCADGAILVDTRHCVFPVPGLYEPEPTQQVAQVQPTQAQPTQPTLPTQEPAQATQPAPDSTQEAQAWHLWHAVGASALLPEHASASFSAHNTTGFPLTADTIIVWDNFGNFYQFRIG